MEATAVSMGKAMLDGALGYAKSKAAEEIALQLGVVRDVNFITNELQMMQSFLMTADEEQSRNKVLMTWVKQIGDLSYKVEDSLMDFGLHNEKKPFLGCIPRSPFDRRRIALEVKELRAEVEDVSNRNLRYRLIKESSGSKPTVAEEHASIATAALFGINEARVATLEKENPEVDLHQLIASNNVDLRVIAVWGTDGDLGKTTAIQEVFDNPKVASNFGFRAWVRLSHPFNPKEFIQCLVRQFYESFPEKFGETKKKETIGSNVMTKMENMSQIEMIDVFDAQVNDSSYLVVIDDLSTIVEWSCIKRFFPDNKKRSRIIVSTQQAEIASLCTEQPYQVSQLNQLSSDQTLYLFHKKINSEEQVSMAGDNAAIFDINETKLAAIQEELEVGLRQQINYEEKDLRVIVVKETGGVFGKLSFIRKVYDDLTINENFGLCAWVTLMHPFSSKEFIQSLVRQFTESSPYELGDSEENTSNVPNKVEKMEQSDLIRVFDAQVRENSYLFVINGISTVEEWGFIKEYFLDYKNQSRIIVSTHVGVEITSLCTEQPYQVIELKQLSSDQTVGRFYDKLQNSEQISLASDSAATLNISEARFATLEKGKRKAEDASRSAQTISDSNKVTATEKNAVTPSSEIQELNQRPKNAGEDSSTATKTFDRSRTLALGVPTGRETDKSAVIRLMCRPDNSQGSTVISVWGMGGLGKTTLVRSVYRSQQLGGWKRAWVTALRPFNPKVLLRDLALQLQISIQEYPAAATAMQKKNIEVMKIQELKDELDRLLKSHKCLVVLDDISSISEWELVKGCLVNATRIILTTREKTIAKHCSGDQGIMYSLEGLKDDAAFDLFIKKVFKMNSKEKDLPPAMMDQARFILKKCNGLPLAISTIGGFLATKPKTAIEWRKINGRISSELEINPELEAIKRVLMKSYDGLPYHLKLAFLYLSIFPEDHKIRWDRLVKRWIAEGYSRDMHGISGEELGRRYFDELLDRSMILPGEELNHLNGKIRFCQLHDIIREICISKAREENLVFTLEDGCCLSSTQSPIRHLVIGSNWKRDKHVLESILDLSHVRSLTVFGEWAPFFISPKMRFLRVLDLEDTLGLRDHHLDQIGQLLHLKYLSIRNCVNIYCLPNNLGDLRHLQTLDVRGTSIWEFPTTITKLRKLQHLHASRKRSTLAHVENDLSIFYSRNSFIAWACPFPVRLRATVKLLRRPQALDDGLNRHDIINLYRYDLENRYGVQIPRAIGKLKALRTLCHVNIVPGKGKVPLKELKELTQLHKLAVFGLTTEDSSVFWSAIAGLNQLRSLSVEAGAEVYDYFQLDSCLGEDLLPPSCIESLKLLGKLVRMTTWIHQLQNLSKLTLEKSEVKQDDAIQALGVLPNLAVLRLRIDSFIGGQLHFQNSSFPSLVVLEFTFLRYLEAMLFEEDAMPRLELLEVAVCEQLMEISGLPFLTSLRDIRLGNHLTNQLKEDVQRQVADHLKHVRLNITH